jgi:hypothetical protein
MLPVICALMLLAGVQLNPALTPHKAAKPALPKVDRNACPFEGCQLGSWTASSAVQLFSTWKLGRKRTATVAKGERVNAITGIHLTLEPLQARVTAPIAEYGLRPGDIVFGYMNHGEGYFGAWFKGFWVEEFDGSGIQDPSGSGCSRKCNAKLLKPGRTEWWVQIRTRAGKIGWTKENEKFDGKDALAGPG